MLRLPTFCLLLAVAVAQNGYEYNKPGKPFGPGTTQNRPGFTPGSPSGFPSSSTAPSFPGRPQSDEYPSTGGSTSSYPGSSSYPTGSQGYPGSSNQRPQAGYPGQGPSSSSFPGQGPSGPTSGGFPGQTGSNYPGQGQKFPGPAGQPGPALGQPGSPGLGPAGLGFVSDGTGSYEGGDYSAIPGEPDKDYPVLTEIPETSFKCDAQAYPGYYADVQSRCQVFHVCANNRTYDFLCPNGTIFSQQVFVCVWWNQFDCNSAPSFFELNANLYDYSITGSKPQSGIPGALNDYSQGSQASSASFPGGIVPQGPSTGYPESSGQQGPSGGYPGSSGGPGPSSNYPGSTGPQGPSGNYLNSGSQRPSNTYPGSTGSQGPSASYPGGTGQSPPSTYPGSSSYPSANGPQGTAASYPGSQGSTSFPGSRPGNSQGYPSGKPSGPSFPTGGSVGIPQGDNGIPAQQPNREYLPPRK